MATQKRYDMEFKKQAVKLAKEIGGKKAAKELNMSPDTLYGWMRKERNGSIDLGPGTRTPENALGSPRKCSSSGRKTSGWEGKSSASGRKTNFWRRPALFSPRAVRSQKRRTNEIHRTKTL